MRKLIVANIVSLDGYFEGPGGNVMALPMDPSFDAYNAERLAAADTLLLGRKTYEGFKGFWPQVGEDPKAAAEQLGIPVELLDTPTHREISRLENAIDKVVVSDGLGVEETEPWRDTTRIVSRAGAHQHIAELKSGPGRDIIVFGSRTLWNDLLAAGPRRRAPPDRRRSCSRRRDACLRRLVAAAPAARHTHVARLEQRAHPLRGDGRGRMSKRGRSAAVGSAQW
jgi:dihydrofolate reductase